MTLQFKGVMEKLPETHEEVEEFILACLPATFGEILRGKDQYSPIYRQVDRGLQRLRKRGVIGWVRHGNKTIWNKTEPSP